MKPRQFNSSTALSILPVQKKSSPFFKTAQSGLMLNRTNDAAEQEADAVASRVMRMPANGNSFFPAASNSIQRCSCGQEEKLQMKGESSATGGTAAPPVVNKVVHSPGESLDAGTRSFMESRFGYDFGKVQVHNDPLAHQSSEDINALAYTHGDHIVFGEGQYQPSTDTGKKLIAHELAHVLQQGNEPTVRRQPKDKEDDLEGMVRSSFILVKGHGNRGNSPADTGIVHMDKTEKLGDTYRKNQVCWEGDFVGINIYFSTSPNAGDGTPPRQIPPFVSAKLKYKEAEALLSYRYEGSDAKPVWYSGPSVDPSPYWYPNMQTFFVYPLNKRATLDIHLEMMDIEEDRLLVYDDTIDFIKCGVVAGCREDALATNRWAVIPANGGPVHPASKTQHDDGPRYEIFKVNGKDSYFICLDEVTRRPVTREGDAI